MEVKYKMKHHVFEAVDVIACFSILNLRILRFKKENTIYRVSRIVREWRSKEGNTLFSHFTLECRQQNIICELALNHSTLKWEFIQYENIY